MSDRKPLITEAPNPYLQSDAPASHFPDQSVAGNAGIVSGASGEPETFPVDCLDTVSATMVREVARVAMVPETLAATCVLGILSSALGGGLQVASHGNRKTRGNLYLLSIAESGTGKGTAFEWIAEPLLRLEREHLDHWRNEILPGLRAKYTLAEQRMGLIKKRYSESEDGQDHGNILRDLKKVEQELTQLKAEMKEPCWIVADCTREALEGMLSTAKGECLASLSPEARGLIDVVAGRYREGVSDESILLSASTGEPYKVHRKNSPPIILRRPCLTIYWMCQPDKIREVMKKQHLADSGFFPRFLICDTQAEPQALPEAPLTFPAIPATDWSDLLETLVDTFHSAEMPLTITPSAEASEILRRYHNEIVPLRRSGGEYHDVASYAARWAEQAWRLSVVLHAGDQGAEAARTPLGADTAQRAVTLAKWFAVQQIALLDQGRQERRYQRVQKLILALRSYPGHAATLRDLQRRNNLSRQDVASAARDYPEEIALEILKPAGGGKTSEVARLVRG